jgi:type VI secretion system secreted protein VgrG
VTGLGIFRKQDWLQMGETDVDFFNRLLEKAGLFYYFIHSESKHEMVITDINYYQTLFELEESDEGQTTSARKLYLSYSEGTQQREDYITQFNYKQNLMPGVFTTLAQKQSAWQEQATAAVSPIFPDSTLGGSSLNIEQLQMVAFGASEHEVRMRNSVLQKQLLTGKMALTGSSTCSEMRCGYKFQLADSAYHRTAQDESDLYAGAPEPIRRELDGVMMVASSVTHNASVDGKYSNQFEAIDAKGHGKAFAPTGDQLGSVLAIVCDGPLVETPEAQRSRKYLPKTDFVDIETQNFSTNTSEEVYTARGVYVRLVTQSDSEDPIWIRLRDDLSTIPERGVYVIVARSSDETEIPELQQILESKGSKNIMPESYTVNTSWGDSYSTSYGDSNRISLSGSATTSIDDAREVVENTTQSSSYDDISFGETSPSSVNLSRRSYSLSISGSIPPSTDVGSLFKASDGITDPDGVTESDYEQYSRSINFGTSYSKNETYGEQKSITTNHGPSYNETYERGGSHNYTEQWGHQNSVTLTHDTSYNETTTYEEQTSITTNHGKQTSTTTNNDHSNN